MTLEVKDKELEGVKKNLQDNSKQLEQIVDEDEDQYEIKGPSQEEIKKKKNQKLKKTLTIVGTGIFFGVCAVTPPFGWVAAAGAVTGAVSGAVVGKGIDTIEKKISQKKMSIKKKKEEEEKVDW